MSNLQIKSERKRKKGDDARIKISSPAGFQYWQMSQNTPSSTFSPLSCIFSTASSHIQDAFPPNLFLSTPIWFWIMFNLFCHYINPQYQ